MIIIHPIIADIVWPALYLELRLFSFWAIAAGLMAELLFVRYITQFSWGKCIIADIGMNAVSSLLGVILIPLAGIAWEFLPGIALYKIFNIGTFNPITWTATFLLAVIINGTLETMTLRYAFKRKIGKKGFWLLCLANTISIGMAFYSIVIYPVRV